MATEVKLPDLGEGVEDATISRWLVKEGDEVKEGDILLEVATDKVDTEIPSPAAGKVLKISQGEGSLVSLSDVLAVIGAEGESAGDTGGTDGGRDGESAKAAEEAKAADGGQRSRAERNGDTPEVAPEVAEEEKANEEAAEAEAEAELKSDKSPTSREKREAPPQVSTPSENGHALKASPVAKRVAADKGVDLEGVSGTGPGGRITKDDVLATAGGGKVGVEAPLPGDLADTASIMVLRLAAQYNVNLREIAAGRPLSTLTRYDVMAAVASREAGESVVVEPRYLPPSAAPATGQAAPAQRAAAESAQRVETKPAEEAAEKPAAAEKAQPKEAPAPAQVGAREELVKHTRMRQAIARTTVNSWTTVPHVTTVWDVDMSAVINHRKAHKNEFAAAGVNLTITAYFVEAILAGLKAVPAANASYTDEGIIIKRYYNIGMAVALPQDKYGLGGLIVPVIKNAGDLNLVGIARAVNELAEKARNNQLRADDLADGTFTLTNYGTSGSRIQTPIIVQPQAGILGVGAIEKRPTVISSGSPLEANAGDSIAFLPIVTLAFSYDHRVLDGATADAYCAAVKEALESY
jgi:2-oxoglutarate dehydrogenase E2 component (dihydrolipoamide succinyltransferase)